MFIDTAGFVGIGCRSWYLANLSRKRKRNITAIESADDDIVHAIDFLLAHDGAQGNNLRFICCSDKCSYRCERSKLLCRYFLVKMSLPKA